VKKFYITTPLYYVNDEPHIGHAYTTILADVINKYYKNMGYDTFFLTGTDEHGQKVEEAAKKNKIEPINHVNEYVKKFKKAWNNLDIEYDYFIRTTDEKHKDVVKNVLNHLYNKGEIYKNEYEGLYSVSEERFITEKEAEEGSFREIKKLKETNYFFKMSKYQKELVDHINKNPNFIQPQSRKNEILSFLKNDLQDLCISRPKKRLSWGIELPFDKDYVTYVWFDALINYISAIGYLNDEHSYNKYWPANYHLMAKDILTTHCVYWPTMLLALNIKLPQTIFAHGWWLMENEKMSKSLGNVIKPLELSEKYGADALRYYLMRNMVLGQDASYTYESFITRYNADLANDFGNVINRITILIEKHFDGLCPEPGDYDEDELLIISKAKNMPIAVKKNIINMKLHDAIENAMSLIRLINKYLEMKKPWKLVKEDKSAKSPASTCLYLAAEILRISTVLLSPIMPTKTKLTLNALSQDNEASSEFGLLKPESRIYNPGALFPRIEI
tara:strand:+ start:5073 stop:6578 length:1506 start_codon:yes stop_codon:yes gene_type:complete